MFNTTGGLSWPKPVYIDVISGTQIGLYNDSGLTDPLLTGEGTVIYSSNIFFIKNGDPPQNIIMPEYTFGGEKSLNILPNYDEERVYVSDIKKLIKWYLIVKELAADALNEPEVVEEEAELEMEAEKVEVEAEETKETEA